MVALTEKDIEALDEYLYPDFGGYKYYRQLVTNIDILRLLTYSGDIEIVRPWNVNLRLTTDYNHLEYKPIEIYSTDFKLLEIFDSNSVFGTQEHIDWLLTRKHGSQFYLKIYTANSINSILCIVVREIPEYEKRFYIKNWLEEIKWSITRPSRIEALLSLNTLSSDKIFNIKIAYLPITDYVTDLTLEAVLESPDSEITNLAVDTYLTLTSVKGGYYAIGLVNNDGSIDWLKLTVTPNSKYIYRFSNGLNYLRLNTNESYTINLTNDNIFNINNILEGNFTKIYTNLVVALELDINIANSEYKSLFTYGRNTSYWLIAFHTLEPVDITSEWYLSNRYRVTSFTINTWVPINNNYINGVATYNVSSNQYIKTGEEWILNYYTIWRIDSDNSLFIANGELDTPVVVTDTEYLKLSELILI